MPASYSKKREPLRPSKTWGSLVATLQRKPSLDILSGESHLQRQPGTSKDRSIVYPSKTPPRSRQARGGYQSSAGLFLGNFTPQSRVAPFARASGVNGPVPGRNPPTQPRACCQPEYPAKPPSMRALGGDCYMGVPAPAHVPPGETNLFKVKEPGWYAFDDDHIPLLGPFNSREECVEAIKKAVA